MWIKCVIVSFSSVLSLRLRCEHCRMVTLIWFPHPIENIVEWSLKWTTLESVKDDLAPSSEVASQPSRCLRRFHPQASCNCGEPSLSHMLAICVAPLYSIKKNIKGSPPTWNCKLTSLESCQGRSSSFAREVRWQLNPLHLNAMHRMGQETWSPFKAVKKKGRHYNASNVTSHGILHIR